MCPDLKKMFFKGLLLLVVSNETFSIFSVVSSLILSHNCLLCVFFSLDRYFILCKGDASPLICGMDSVSDVNIETLVNVFK